MQRPGLIDRLALSLVHNYLRSTRPVFEESLIRMVQRSLEVPSYRRLKGLGFQPATAFDIGAHNGTWSRAFRKIFPDCRMEMFEALAELEPDLSKTCDDIGNANYNLCLLTAKPEENVEFFVLPPGSQSGSSTKRELSNIKSTVKKMSSMTLDGLVENIGSVAKPLFIKIDVQGAELEVLGGGLDTLQMAEWVQLEVAVLPYNNGAPDMREIMQFMNENGFFATEIVGFSRPIDHLVQIDLFFAREGSSLRPSSFSF